MKTMSDTSEEIPDNATDRPLVTFALFAYNQEKYIRDAMEGAFSQTYEPLEIILSDDCSSDRTFEIMQEMAAAYVGPHDVHLRRNEVNLGLATHVNVVIANSYGEIIVVAAGDDVSLPNRASISIDLLQRHADATAVLLSADVIDQSGQIIGKRLNNAHKAPEHTQTILDLLRWKHITFGATRAVRREVFTKFGPLNDRCPTEDTPLLLRSLLLGTNVISQKKSVLYRRHNGNLSGASSMKKMDIKAIYQQYEDDLKTAQRLNLVSDISATQLRKWMPLDHRIRDIRNNISLGEKIHLRDAVFFILHPLNGFRSRVKFIMWYLISSRIFP